jgi:hypothetical protein
LNLLSFDHERWFYHWWCKGQGLAFHQGWSESGLCRRFSGRAGFGFWQVQGIGGPGVCAGGTGKGDLKWGERSGQNHESQKISHVFS